MENPKQEQLLIRQQILMLQQNYEVALQQGKEFGILKQLMLQIRALEEMFRQMGG